MRTAAIVLLAAPLAAVPALAGKSYEKVRIEGRVLDADGAAVAGVPVRLLKTRSLIRPGKFALEEQVVEGGRARTDEEGFFEMEIDRDYTFKKYFLRFYDPKQFDAVRFAIPEDREITRKIRKERPILVTAILQFADDWPEIRKWIERYGSVSKPAEILRALGLPDRVVETDDPERVDWCYDEKGICYQLLGNEVLGQEGALAAVSAGGEEE